METGFGFGRELQTITRAGGRAVGGSLLCLLLVLSQRFFFERVYTYKKKKKKEEANSWKEIFHWRERALPSEGHTDGGCIQLR